MARNYRVLAVEDDTDTLQLIRLVLRGMPLKVLHASTGEEAIAFLEREIPDLVFLDISLPDMHGWRVLEHFKDDTRLNRMRVIVLTSHAEPVHRLIGTLQPISFYLNKPVAADELRRRVSDLLDLNDD